MKGPAKSNKLSEGENKTKTKNKNKNINKYR